MKILYTNFHSGHGGGHDTYISGLAAAMSGDNEVTVASPRGSHLSQQVRRIPGVRVVEIDFKPRWQRFLANLVRLRSLITESRFDVIHVNGSADHRQVMLAIAGCASKPAIVFTKHNTRQANSVGNFFRARFATTRTIAVSDYVHDMLSERSPYRHVTVIKHGVFSPVPGRPSREEVQFRKAAYFGPASANTIVLGSVAGTAHEKGWGDLVTALGQLPAPLRRQFRVLLAGHPPTADQLQQVRQYGLASQITYTGLSDRVSDILTATDVSFVLSYGESLSYACREAMSMGRPVIVTNVGGLPENVEDGVDGWIVPPHGPDAIARVLFMLASQRELIPLMGHAALRKSRREFSFSKFLEATRSVYLESVRLRRPSAAGGALRA
ncbi:glycosyltransferase [Paraburkholderia sabiae]|uniref:Glycosyltransferase n=1 Tax=Paraburkholderia sabiae TaxID=273251 RepID=A0ABU9QLS0_9BURK|nr:glycosyltransferase [Paraburkholderia sabiae]WJZ77315.1 glycosyltransferase [Paraburkholderia sabiae]CAD6547930.1 D-inositol-3-phosphate glycosyltransferase [Paraburkholderia sabiae]